MANTNIGVFVPTTNVWDVDQIYEVNVNSPEFKELLIRLYQNINIMSLAVNAKETGVYNTLRFPTSQSWFPNPAYNSTTATSPTQRQAERLVINFGALPNAATKSVPHNLPINPSWTFTEIKATATDTTGLNSIPIPYAAITDVDNIELNLDLNNVNITTGSNRTNFNECVVVIEFLTN
jgi:hypothetical protein